MKTTQEANRRYWSSQQQILRRWLMKDRNFQQALPLVLSQHAMMHTASLQPGGHWSYQDEVLNGLDGAQMRCIPKSSAHSVAWALWHITRIEDVTTNILLADTPQLLHHGNWLSKLGTSYEGVGNELSPDEIAEVSATINLKALLAYRLAVGKRTRAIVRRLKPEILWATPASERMQRLSTEGAVSERAAWLLKYWGGHPSANLLLMPATRHGFMHLNEIQRMLPKLRRLEAISVWQSSAT
jgi:hypothetical protein